MCVGVPMRVIAAEAGIAVCEGRGRRERINTLLLGEVQPGSWLLAFQGSAVRPLSEEEAAQTDAALDALEAALAGHVDLVRHFGDLAERVPELPAHLRGDD